MSKINSRFKGKLVPPVILLLCALFIIAVKKFTITTPIYPEYGNALVLLGIITMVTAALQFRRAQTPLVPGTTASQIVDSGIFNLSRNPMYLGMLFMLLGGSWMSGSLLSTLAPLYFVAHIEKNFIENEEEFLEELFGDTYKAYKKRVRRWI
ncbi:isoprenylcysteine carboxylmethyltransferase family protein [Temperatibacter marinus]|uniref:Isoprenylcysteine carboxylmethyltransferase family protein n=1 Tax=Temperatibacter marinus TaxID=1456591 RepID=A0AA52EBI7_9PROT|nr:isoprenylcysteine carboxylmethyltransferase family protein [Temperatibacter marinus]WND01786.1 isoprenylcysteine carboxylmethyltransferase family protein [Temperatibacter marinus]